MLISQMTVNIWALTRDGTQGKFKDSLSNVPKMLLKDHGFVWENHEMLLNIK
jgi:hypothetical protein